MNLHFRELLEQEEERVRKQEELAKKDAELAQQLLEEENLKIAREKEKRDSEAVIALIRAEAEAELSMKFPTIHIYSFRGSERRKSSPRTPIKKCQ